MGKAARKATGGGGERAGRNQPCSCGSGRKAKHCHGVHRGPSEAALATAALAALRHQTAPALRGCTDFELHELLDAMVGLPARDLSVQLPLPALFSPELDSLAAAVRAQDTERVQQHLAPVLAVLDTPAARLQLAQAVVALRDAGTIDARLAAMAVADLSGGAGALLPAALVRALLVADGAATTPSGLVIARR